MVQNLLTVAYSLRAGTQLVTVTIIARSDSSGRPMSGSTADTHQIIVVTAKALGGPQSRSV
jgi:hypothetical protein